MRIVAQQYKIEYYEPKIDIDRICKAARLCYKSSKIKNYDEQCRFVYRLLNRDKDNPHESPLEHSSLSVKFITNRGISHELVRHRLTSPNQESTRYCLYSSDRFENTVSFISDTAFTDENPMYDIRYANWLSDCEDCEKRYFRRLKEGFSADEARGVLNNDVKTEIMITANYREWLHILKLRTSPQAHYQMRELMTPLAHYLAEDLPCVFGKLIYDESYLNDIFK